MRWHFVKAAELKRFQLHSRQSTRCLNNAGWEGGLSKLRTGSFLTKMATRPDLHARPHPSHPPKSCQFVTVTPLRSVPHHKLCSETLPPAHTMRWHFVKAAELKRFQLHLLVQLSPQRRAGGIKPRRMRCTSSPNVRQLEFESVELTSSGGSSKWPRNSGQSRGMTPGDRVSPPIVVEPAPHRRGHSLPRRHPSTLGASPLLKTDLLAT